MKKLFFCICVFIVFVSCKKELSKVEKVTTAFYYWKTKNWTLKKEEKTIIKKSSVEKLYVKFFEIANDEIQGNIPVSKNKIRIKGPYNPSKNPQTNIVPCVYIRNEVFKKSSKKELDELAENIHYLVEKKKKENFRKRKVINEIQIDCDWTLSTKDNYFYFLEKIKESSKKEISCTLRLYPYKYPEKMGVPPVDKAMLMCYNLINPSTNKEKNSILDIEELKKYLIKGEKYPKHLDVALPLYSWMQVFQNNEFTKVIYKDFNEIKKVTKPIKPLWLEVTKDTTAADTYLRIGDKIKYDEITLETIKKAIEIIKENVYLDKEITFSFFHLDQEQLKHLSNEEITNLYTLIRE